MAAVQVTYLTFTRDGVPTGDGVRTATVTVAGFDRTDPDRHAALESAVRDVTGAARVVVTSARQVACVTTATLDPEPRIGHIDEEED